MLKQKRNSLHAIQNAFSLLNRPEVFWAVGLTLLAAIAAILESSLAALVFPLVYALIDPTQLDRIPKLKETILGFGQNGSDLVPVLLGLLSALIVIATLLKYLVLYLTENQAEQSRNRLAHEILGAICDAPYTWFVRQNSAELVRTVFDDIRIWRRDCIDSVVSITSGAFLIIFPSAVVLAISPFKGLVAILAIGLVGVLVTISVRKPIQRFAAKSRSLHNSMLVGLSQILNGMREVKLSGNQNYFLTYFDRLHQNLNRNALNARLMGNVPGGVLGLLGQIAFIASAMTLWFSGMAGVDIVAHLAVIAVVVARILPAVNKIIASVSTLTRSLPYVEGLLTLIREAKAGKHWLSQVEAGAGPMPENWRTIELKNISYSYGSGSPTIKNFSFKFERGKRYGLVGRSGSGKSTLISVFLGLIFPDGGQIYVDGVPRDRISSTEWTKVLAYVPQDVLILDDSLQENVIFGSGIPSTRAWFDETLRRACIDTLFEGTHRDLETKLGERGRQISGGQAQRIAIARALYRKPSILVLDEATSALDSETERVIQENIRKSNSSGLTITVAHRLASLRNYDQILVLDMGVIEHSGTYEELIVTSEIFRRLATEDESDLTQNTAQ